MKIERIRNNLYDQKGQYQKYFLDRNHLSVAAKSKPIDSVIFDIDNSKKNHDLQKQQDHFMLKAYVNALSDEEVNKRMKQFRNSFEQIDSAIIDKLIMEAL